LPQLQSDKFFKLILSYANDLFFINPGKTYFESVCIYCGNFGDQIPITFILGFYVSLIVNRWWDQFEHIPWPDSASLWVSTCIQGQDERGRLMRRTIVRYLNLGFILTLRLTCLPVKKRFPTLEHLVEAGILEEKEREVRYFVWTFFYHTCNKFFLFKWNVAKPRLDLPAI